MTALSKPFSVATTSGTAKPKTTKTLPKAASKARPAKSVKIKSEPPIAVKVAGKAPVTKSRSSVSVTSPVKPGPSAPASNTAKPDKVKKIKLVRDSFTIPKAEYLVLDVLKLRAADMKYPVKKGELLRAGIKALAAMGDAHLLAALQAVPTLKTGRPSK